MEAVCLIGVDGAGKTSIARRMAGILRERGVRVRVAWLRGTHTLASLAARLLHALGARGDCNPYYHVCVPERLRGAWAWLEAASIIPVIAGRFKAPGLLGYTVIGDRGPLDLIVWIRLTLGMDTRGTLLERLIIAVSRATCRSVYVRASLEALLSRRRGTRDERLIPAELQAYDELAARLKLPVIDTTSTTVEEAAKTILEEVGWCTRVV